MRNTDTHIYEVEFADHGNPKEPEYRWFSDIGQALAFMNGITGEMHVAHMTYRSHAVDASPGAFAQFLNQLSSRQAKTPEDEIPF